MFRKNYFTILLMPALLVAGSIVASAQSAPVSGTVMLKKTDNTSEPVAGATVEVYRTDIKAKLPSTKTNKKGEFSFAGFQLGGIYTLSISAPNTAPTYLPNVKAGIEKLVINVTEGDGRKLTEEEVRSSASVDAKTSSTTSTTSANTEPSADQKKSQEDRAKLEAEYTAKKTKADSDFANSQATLKAGNAAYDAKNYDLAISEYEKGYQANPTFAGSAPGFLNNKATALGERARESYNQSIKLTDTNEKIEASKKVTKDFGDAIDALNTSWTLLKNATPTEVNKTVSDANKKQALEGARSIIRYMILTERVDSTRIPAISSLLTEYLAFETDAVKKAEAEAFMGDVYRLSNDCSTAITEYKKTLEKSPNNVDALGSLGLCQVNGGFNADGSINEPAMQEAINNLQKFVDTAPGNYKNQKLKDDVIGQIDSLKKMNIKPVKTTPAKGGKKKS